MRLLFISGCRRKFNSIEEKYLAENAINYGRDGRLFDLTYSNDHKELNLR